ncbi:MAG: ATP-binding cassette domain-containing protein [Christensenellales bacterium]
MLKVLEIENLENRSFSELSGGQQQRVLLARALCATDKVLILDEPFTGLDGSTAKKLYEVLDKINKELGVTLIIVSHFVEDLLKHANKVIHLSQECLFCGNPEEYKNHLKKEYLLSRHQLFEVGDEND